MKELLNLLLAFVTLSASHGASLILLQPKTHPYPVHNVRYRSAIIPPLEPYIYPPFHPNQNSMTNARSIVLVPAYLHVPVQTPDDHNVAPVNLKVNQTTPPQNQTERSGLDSEEGTTKKPRCLQSLFGWYAKKKIVGAMENFNAPDLPDFRAPPGSGVQGGVPGAGPGYGLSQSQFTPDLSQAHNALNDAKLMESQVNSAQAQLNSQLGGVPSSGIPLSSAPPALFRNNGETTTTEVDMEGTTSGLPQEANNANLGPSPYFFNH